MEQRLNSIDRVEDEIYEKRKEVRYDTREMTLEFIAGKFQENLEDDDFDEVDSEGRYSGVIYIPDYQREFTWDEKRQSKLMESIILGLPLPSIFIAENKSGAWEIIDGSQRIRSIHAFLTGKLCLEGLKVLKTLNGYHFGKLDSSRQRKIQNTALRIIVLSEETTDEIKTDMFDRINRGSDLLKPMEKRKGSYPGRFNQFIYSYCKEDKLFQKLVKVDRWLDKRQEREELLLRFFALSEGDKIANVGSGIADFLDQYMKRKNAEWGALSEQEYEKQKENYRRRIDEVNKFVEEHFPYGYCHRHNPQTKRSVFEAISVGVRLVLYSRRKLAIYQNKW